jgi:hypothetical protein
MIHSSSAAWSDSKVMARRKRQQAGECVKTMLAWGKPAKLIEVLRAVELFAEVA